MIYCDKIVVFLLFITCNYLYILENKILDMYNLTNVLKTIFLFLPISMFLVKPSGVPHSSGAEASHT